MRGLPLFYPLAKLAHDLLEGNPVHRTASYRDATEPRTARRHRPIGHVTADGVSIVWASKLRGTPLPGRVNGTAYAHQGRATLVRAAEAICQGRYPLLSYENLTLGFPPPWHLD